MTTANEVLTALLEERQRLLEVHPEQATTAELVMIWRRELFRLSEGQFVKTFTQKEVGQLQHLRKKLVAAGLDPIRTVKLLLEHWPEFVAAVSAEKKVTLAPEVPVIGFALRHSDILINAPA